VPYCDAKVQVDNTPPTVTPQQQFGIGFNLNTKKMNEGYTMGQNAAQNFGIGFKLNTKKAQQNEIIMGGPTDPDHWRQMGNFGMLGNIPTGPGPVIIEQNQQNMLLGGWGENPNAPGYWSPHDQAMCMEEHNANYCNMKRKMHAMKA